MGDQTSDLAIFKHSICTPSTAFVGRQKELTLLQEQYQAVLQGTTRVVFLIGDQGIGKTRLLHEFAARAQQAGALPLHGNASDSEGMPPFLPFLEALGGYIRQAPLAILKEQCTGLTHSLLRIFPELALRLGELPTPAYPSPPEQSQLRLYEAVGYFLTAISRTQPLLLLLDDLHWCDSASFTLLSHIVRHQRDARILIVGAFLSGGETQNRSLDHTLNNLIRQRTLTMLTLQPLSFEQIAILSENYLGSSIEERTCRFLYEQSEGNPFFTEELLQNWLETNLLVKNEHQWEIAPETPLPQQLPPSIVGTLRQRFQRLPSNTIDILRIAATIGRSFDLSLLTAITGLESEIIEDRLLAAEQAHLVTSAQPETYRFTHDTIRATLYLEVSSSRRRRLHEQIGQTLEQRYTSQERNSLQRLAELTFHFIHSTNREKIITYSRYAAEAAQQNEAIEEALHHYRRILDLLDARDPQRGQLLLKIGELTSSQHREAEAIATFETALHWFIHNEDPLNAARAAHCLGRIYWAQRNIHLAQSTLEYALSLYAGHQEPEIIGLQLDLATLLTLFLGQSKQGALYARKAEALARMLKQETLEALANHILRFPALTGEELHPYLQSLEAVIAEMQHPNLRAEAALGYWYLTRGACRASKIRRAGAISRKRLDLMPTSGHLLFQRDTYIWLAYLHTVQGDWKTADALLTQLPGSHAYPALLTRGFTAYLREEYAEAKTLLQQALQASRNSLKQADPALIGLLALTELATNNHSAAHMHMQELKTWLSVLPDAAHQTAPALVFFALLALAYNDQATITYAYTRLKSFEGLFAWFLVDRILGMLALRCQQQEQARAYLQRAEQTARSEGLHPELIQVILAQAALQPESNRLLKHALHLSEELALHTTASRIRQQLDEPTDMPESPPLPANLTRREKEVLRLVAKGRSNKQIARSLNLSERTVANHISNILHKIRCENRVAATTFAIRHKLV
uniref:HTH luxR-type domain-containing protein n=1 Tax=Thermosporothrix sp. COM3 TaxID=2490863 RepID=A0A455STE6_9CHLR|nr:hypothetical protein KTC_31650 [Thermosporothrix sp. COM3]